LRPTYGGTIEVRTDDGRGASFELALPLLTRD
jgi:signal transduction histidine kinase